MKKFTGGRVFLNLSYPVDISNKEMVEDARTLLREDLETAIKYGEIHLFPGIKIIKDSRIKKSDIPEVLKEKQVRDKK